MKDSGSLQGSDALRGDAHDEQGSQQGETQSEAGETCRICFSGEYDDTSLLQGVCACSGTSSYIHLSCLETWRDALRAQGQWKRANRCEVCQQPWDNKKISQAQRRAGRFSLLAHPRALLSMCSRRLLTAADCPSWSVLAWRLWRAYIFSAGCYSALVSGGQGLKAGAKLGRGLVEKQSKVLVQLLAALADLLGTPATEVLWLQVVAGVVFALASEFMYSAIMGLFGGAVLGFANGYVGAIRGTFKLLGGAGVKLFQGSRSVLRIALLGLGLRKARHLL